MTKIEDLIDVYSSTGFNGRQLGDAAKLYAKMIENNATICLTMAGAMTPVGFGGIVKTLIENGFVHKVNSLNAFVGCSHPLKHQDCYFLICDSCNDISEYCDPAITSAIKTITKRNQFTVKNTTLEIAGRCNSCIQHTD